MKYYTDNSVGLWSCIQNINKHFLHHCHGSQYYLSVYRIHMIILTSITSLTELSFSLCLLLVFAGKWMTGFDLLTNYHSDLESLLRKPHTRVPSLGSARSIVREIIDQFRGSSPSVVWQNHLRNEVFIASRSIEWFSMKWECIKHTYEAYKTKIIVEIKLLQLGLKITR
jgi:hypothetical protein